MKKVKLLLLCGIIVLGICGCGKSFESEIVGNTFISKIESDDSTFGKIITSHTLIFKKDNKGTSKIDIEFTGDFKEYAENHISYDTRHTSTDYTYTLNEKDNTINFTVDDDIYNLRYDKDTKCLIDTEKETIKWCK